MKTLENTCAVSGRIPEYFALFLTFLLPLKFSSTLFVPEFPASYWFDPYSILLMVWPGHLFALLSLILLALCMIFRPGAGKNADGAGEFPDGSIRVFACCFLLLALVSFLGFLNASTRDFAWNFLPYLWGLAAYLASLSLLLSRRNAFAVLLFRALLAGAFVSMLSGFNQYFFGFQNLQDQLYEESVRQGVELVQGQFKSRILEQRVSADFSACNTYGGYLAMLLPLIVYGFWRFGENKVEPFRVSRWLLAVPVGLAFLFLLKETGSRGAILSLLAGFAFAFAALKMKFRYRAILILGILAAAAGFIWMVLSGRGFLSMHFRFDYYQAAFKMMLAHPWAGSGWGDFFHDYLSLKNLVNTEAPHTPHNMLLLFGSQCGGIAFLLSLFALSIPALRGIMTLKRAKADLHDREFVFFFLLCASFFTGLFDVMLEVSFETPGFGASFLAIALLLLAECKKRGRRAAAGAVEYSSEALPNARSSASAGRRYADWIAVAVLVLLLLLPGLYMTGKAIVREKAYSELFEALDPRFQREMSIRQAGQNEFLQKFKAAESVAPDSALVYVSAADYMMMNGNPDAALHYIDKALQRSPERPDLYFRRAKIQYRLTQRIRSAAEDLAVMRRLSPKNPDLQKSDEALLIGGK